MIPARHDTECPELGEYEIPFRRNPLFGWWVWDIRLPDGGMLHGPLLGACTTKEAAEKDALRRIENHRMTYAVSGLGANE